MEPDAFGLALGTGVLAGVLVGFGVAVRLVSGTAALLSTMIGRTVADGIAAWARTERVTAPPVSPAGGDDGPSLVDLGPSPDGVRPLERLGATRTRVRCAPSAPAALVA